MHLLNDIHSLDPLIKDIGDRKIVMLGEASHGTHEYYTWRTAISKRLISEKAFRFIAVEGDWPDCYLINRYVKGYKDAGTDIKKILQSFDRWPSWMWANWEVAALAEWLREYNKPLKPEDKIGFYGLDMYSLWDSMKVMLHYLEKNYPLATPYVEKAIECFEPYNENEHAYARSSFNDHHCRDEVIALLKKIRTNAKFMDGEREAGFNTEQNARIVVNAEKYYRTMIGFNNESWNTRDRHMMETFKNLLAFHGPASKGIVWGHNTHIGDAKATNMSAAGMINIGQLARKKYGSNQVYLAGFAGYEGTVIAGEAWGAAMKEMNIPPARAGTIEGHLHEQVGQNCYLLFSEEQPQLYQSKIGHRAIGVVYDSGTERKSDYVPSFLPKRYDTLLYFEYTKALHPLLVQQHDIEIQIPETYPFGL